MDYKSQLKPVGRLSPKHAASIKGDSPVMESPQFGSALPCRRQEHKALVDSRFPDDLSRDLR